MNLLSTLFLFLFFPFPIAKAAEGSFTSPLNVVKNEFDCLWDDMMRNIASFKKLNKTGTFGWLFDFFSVKEYVTENPVVLTQCLDLLIYELLSDVFALNGIIKFTALPELEDLDFNPPLDYFKKMEVRVNLLISQASKLPEISKAWVLRLCKVQKTAVGELLEKMKSELPIRVEGSEELADKLNILCDFRSFFKTHTLSEVPLDIELLAALSDSSLVFKMFKDGYAGLAEHPLEFPASSLIPAFLVYYEKARPHLPLRTLYRLLLHARKALSPLYVEYEDRKHRFDIIRMLSVIPDVFPTIEDKIGRLRVVLTDARELCLKGHPFNDPRWDHRQTTLSTVIYGLHLLDNESSKINVVSTIADMCLIGIGGIMAEKNSKLLGASAIALSHALGSKHMAVRVQVLKNAEEFLSWYSESSPDAKHWLHIMFELIAICHCAIDEYVKPLSEPLRIGKSYAIVYKNLHDRMSSQYGSLKNLKGEKLFEAGDLFCKNERIRLGLADAELVKSDSIKIKAKSKEPRSEFKPSPDNIDELVAHIDGPKMSEPKPEMILKFVKTKTDKIDKNVASMENTESEDDEVDSTGYTSEVSDTSETSGNSSSPEQEHDEEGSSMESPSETPNGAPVHIMALVDSEDVDLLDSTDARDIVYAYLLIGNSVFYRFLSPLIARLQPHGFFLYPVFLRSLTEFESEMQMLWMTQRAIVKEIFEGLGIDGMAFFGNCVKFYGKRLRVAHQHAPSNLETRKSFSRMHLFTLNASVHSFCEKGSDTTDEHRHAFNWTPSPTFKVHAFTTENRTGLPSEDDINYELSILGLSGLFKTQRDSRLSGGRASVKLGPIRRPIAHQRPSNILLAAIINRLFPDSQHYHFLHKLLL